MNPADTSLDSATHIEVRHLRHESWEKVLPIVGLSLTVFILVEVTVTWFLDPLLGPVLFRTVLAELFPGREASIPIGLTGHIDEIWLWQITWSVDMAYFCFLYPLFLTILHRRHGKGGFIMRRIEKLEAAAYRHERFAHRYGPWGVFLFMLIPFLVNGPLVGMIVGRIAGLPTRRLFAPVISANLFSNAVWVFLYDRFFWQLRNLSESFQQAIALGVFGALFLAAIIGIAVDEWRERRKRVRPSRVRL